METILVRKNQLEFGLTTTFKGQLLVPIVKNVLYKAETEWDDYDEVYHCTHLIERIRATGIMKIDFHFIRKNQQIIGVLLATYGDLDYRLFF